MPLREVLDKVEPALPNYGVPLAHPDAAKPLNKILARMAKMKHARPHGKKLKRKERFY